MGGSRVIVGLDGCDACMAALRYAIEEAGRRGCELVVVAAYEGSVVREYVSGCEVVADGDPEAEAQAMARLCLQRAGVGVGVGVGISPDGPAWQIVIEEMRPADAMAAAASGACAIVVGRHHGQVGGGKPTGSTTTSLLKHSSIPVISVPPGYRYEHLAFPEARTSD